MHRFTSYRTVSLVPLQNSSSYRATTVFDSNASIYGITKLDCNHYNRLVTQSIKVIQGDETYLIIPVFCSTIPIYSNKKILKLSKKKKKLESYWIRPLQDDTFFNQELLGDDWNTDWLKLSLEMLKWKRNDQGWWNLFSQKKKNSD